MVIVTKRQRLLSPSVEILGLRMMSVGIVVEEAPHTSYRLAA